MPTVPAERHACAMRDDSRARDRADIAVDSQPLRVTSSELLREGRELVIVHQGREYRLRITQNDKLILTA